MSDAPPEEDPADAAIEEYLKLLDGGGEVDRTAFLAAHPESAEALRSFFGSVSLLQQLAGPGGLAGTDTSGALTRPPRGLNFSDEDATDSRLPWTTLPAMFGRYRVESLLGRGAMGEVYRAHDTQLDRPVALKLSHFPRNTVLELRERLLQEARAAANLSHPNICRVYDVGEIDGTRFIAMELIEGRPLADYIRTNRLPPPKTAATLIRKLALALQMAHDKGVVHRDLKPTNVIVKADHEPILMDFGLAQRPVPIGEERLTKEGMLIGSPAYMSPEQARADGSTIGPTSDIYSLGVVLYELLTGQLPFTGSVMTILAKVLSEEPPMLHSIRPEIDRDLSDICRKMLAKRPEERFTSMSEVAEALQRWLKSAAKSSRELAVKTESTAKAGASASPAPLRKLTPGQVESLTLSARRCVKHHDYVQATKLLESIPYSQHTDKSRSLLSKAQELGDEVELLIADMDQAVSLKQLETLPATLTRLLKLRPGYLPAKELLDRINSYGSGERRRFRFSQSGELLPGNPEEALFHGVGRMMVMLLLFGVVVFAGTSWYVWSYLLDPLRTVQVEIDDPTVTVVIDDQTVALSEGKGEVRLRSGSHGWTALKEGLPLKSAKFSVGKDHAGTLVIRLNSESQHVANPSAIAKEITSKTTGMKLALIPAGNFLMGSPATEELRSQDEGPQHSVQISKSFYMGIHEVTQDQYVAVMGTNPSEFSKNGDQNKGVIGIDTSQFPVEHVSWFDAIEFCNELSEADGAPVAYILTDVVREKNRIKSATVTRREGYGYRLPTEAEWEYACRAGTSTPFHFGNYCNGTEANVDGDVPYGTTIKGPNRQQTVQVGSFNPNAFGLFDMHGNVSEWCYDPYSDSAYLGRTSTIVDPITILGELDHVSRGGSYFNVPRLTRSACRNRYYTAYVGRFVGFRVVRGVSGTINDLATNRQTATTTPPRVGQPSKDVTPLPQVTPAPPIAVQGPLIDGHPFSWWLGRMSDEESRISDQPTKDMEHTDIVKASFRNELMKYAVRGGDTDRSNAILAKEPKWQSYFLMNHGIALAKRGERLKSEKAFSDAVAAAPEDPSPVLRVAGKRLLAQSLEKAGLNERVKTVIQEAEAICRAAPDPVDQFHSWRMLAINHLQRRDTIREREAWTKSTQAGLTYKDQNARTRDLQFASNRLAELGDYIQSLNAAKGIGQSDTRDSSIIFLAERWAEFADVKVATDACQKEVKDVGNRRRLNAVLAIARAKPDQWQEATTAINVIGKPKDKLQATLYLVRKQLKSSTTSAWRTMMQAEKIAQAIEPADQRDAAYTKIVEGYVAAAKERKSDEALRLALTTLSSAQIGNVSGRDIMYYNVASQQVEMGQIEPAKATLKLMTRHQNVRRMVAQAIAKALAQKKDTGLVGWIQSLPDTVVRAAAYSGVLQAMLDVEM